MPGLAVAAQRLTAELLTRPPEIAVVDPGRPLNRSKMSGLAEYGVTGEMIYIAYTQVYLPWRRLPGNT